MQDEKNEDLYVINQCKYIYQWLIMTQFIYQWVKHAILPSVVGKMFMAYSNRVYSQWLGDGYKALWKSNNMPIHGR